MKKLISFFLVMVMVLSVMPVTFAAETFGTVSNLPAGWNQLNIDSFKNGTYSAYADNTANLYVYKDVATAFASQPMTIVQTLYADKDTEKFTGSGEYASFKINKSADIYLSFGFSDGNWQTSGLTTTAIQAPAWVENAGWEPLYIDTTAGNGFGDHNGILLEGSAAGIGFTGRITRPYKKTVIVPDGETVEISLKGADGGRNVNVPYVILIDWKENAELPVAAATNAKVGLVDLVETDTTVEAKVWMENADSDFGLGAEFLFAKYDNESRLISVDKKEVTVSPLEKNIFTTGAISKPDTGSMKIFLWHNQNITPLANVLNSEYSGELLKGITINGETFADFDENKTSYTISVEDGSTVPVVKGIAADNSVYVTTVYGNISADGKSVTHTVKAEGRDGRKASYTLTFKIDEVPLVVAPNGESWNFENGKSNIALATPGVTKDGVATADGILYEAFNNTAPVPDNVKITLGSGAISQVVGNLPFFLTDNTDDGTAANHFGYSSDYSGENWITFTLGKPATVYILSQLNSGAARDIHHGGIQDAGWTWVANDYYTMPMMGSGKYFAYFSKSFDETLTYPLEVKIPVSTDESKAGQIGYTDYVVALKEAASELVGLKPLVSDVTNYVKDKDFDAYYKYINGDSATGTRPTSNLWNTTDTIDTINDIAITSFVSGTNIKGFSSFGSFVDYVNPLTGYEGSYVVSLPSMVARWEGISTWVHHAALGVSNDLYSTSKPWWSFKVNADCEITVLAHDNVIIPAYEEAGSGWTKTILTENPGGLHYSKVGGTQNNMLNKTAYTKKFTKGSVVQLYNAKRTSGSDNNASVTGSDVVCNVSNLYIPIIKF